MAKELTIKINIEGQDVVLTSKQLEIFKKNADNLKKSLDELGQRTEQNAEQFDKLKGDLEALEKIFAQTKDEVTDTGDEFGKTDGKAKSLRTQIRELTNQLQALGPRTADNAAQFDALTTQLIELQEVQEDVGFQTQKLDDALSAIPGPIGQAVSQFKVFDDGLKNARAAMISLTKTFPILKNAIAATGIGALVILIGALIAAVVKAFNTFKPLQDAVARLGVLFDVLEKAIQPLIDLIGEGLVVVLDGLARALAFVTGQTEEFNRALADKQALDNFNRNLEEQQFQLEILGDTYDEFERRRVEARIQANERIKELNENEVLDEEEKNRRKLLVEERYQRDINNINKDRETKDREEREKRIEEKKKENERLIQLEIERLTKIRDAQKRDIDANNTLILKSLELDQDNLDSRIKLVNERARLEIESVKELSKDLIQETELTNRVINLIIDNAAKEKQRINEEYALRSIQIFNDANNAEVFNRELTNQRLENALFETVNLYEGTAKFADIFIGKLSKRMSDQMMEQFEALNDFRDLYKERYEVVENAIDMELNLLDGYFRIGLIDYETYVGELNRLDQERINNKSRLVQQNIALDRLEVDSRRISADESIRIAENLAGFLSAIAGESKALQIASALTEAAVAIARIITDTQRAIVAFSASVAPLGPAGLKMAAGYAIKAKISAGLSIATITAQAIGKLKGIQGQGSGSDGNAGGGRQSNNLGRGYADGGLVTGPGTSRSDSIPARLSNGEFVMNGASTAMFLPMLEMLNNAGRQTSVPSLMTTLPDAPESNNKSEMIVKTYVVESDLTSTQHKQARLKNLSTL